MKDELGGKIMTKFLGSRAKTYNYLIDDGVKIKRQKEDKKCVIERNLKIKNAVQKQLNLRIKETIQRKMKLTQIYIFYYKRKHKEFIKNSKIILKTRKGFKSERHDVFIEEDNKIALSLNDDKRIQLIDSTET